MYDKPNFLLIGAARSGTTSLHGMLIQHPEIFLPKNKQPEPHYFLKTKEYEKGDDYYRSKYFDEVRDEKAIGEISTSYLFGEKVPKRIAEFNPEMNLVCILRNPSDRAYSNYWHSKKNGFENLDFIEAIKTADQRHAELNPDLQEVAPYAYVGRGQYGFQLEHYLQHFPARQIHLIILEEFIQNQEKYWKELLDFLNVDSSFVPNFELINKNNSRPENFALSNSELEFISPYFRESNQRLFKLLDREIEAW